VANKAVWCTQIHAHLEHVGVHEGQVVVCDGMPPHPDLVALIEGTIDDHCEATDYDGDTYSPWRCDCGVVGTKHDAPLAERRYYDTHRATEIAKAVLKELHPFLNFPYDDGDGFDWDKFPPAA
jgi:hypothetical protein